MKRWRVLATVRTTLITEVEADDRQAALALACKRSIERVRGDGRENEVWVVPDGSIERAGLETDLDAQELDADEDDECPREARPRGPRRPKAGDGPVLDGSDAAPCAPLRLPLSGRGQDRPREPLPVGLVQAHIGSPAPATQGAAAGSQGGDQ